MFRWLRGKKPSDDPYAVFRGQALSVMRMACGIAQPPPEYPIWGMLMDLALPNGMVASLLALADGTSSMYFSTGGAVIGGHSHESVRQAASAFLETANRFYRSMKPTSTTPLPAMGRVAFYARTDAGLLNADADESELRGGRHQLSPLYIAGHDLIAELRKASQSKEQKNA